MSYEYEIQGNYGHGWDTLTTEETRALALDQLKVYRENERIPLRMKRVNA
jgi:hypothetical protein